MMMNQVTATIERSPNSIPAFDSAPEPAHGPSVSADDFIRPEAQSSIVTLDHRRLVQHDFQFKVSVRRGEMVSNPASNIWPFSMEVAAECRMQNVECSMVSPAPSTSSFGAQSVSLVFTTTRPVDKGQRLYFWFSEMMLAQLEMPFLVPKNIQAGDRYVCHRCPAVFTTPNPLKLHLFFHCSQRTVALNTLWSHIYSALVKPSSGIDLFVRHHSKAPGLFIPALMHPAAHHAPGASAAQVETLVSHLGRSKHGHVCIYCGKIYSRKYGLKIHIRTHTGYKPLKCPVCSRPFGDPSNLNKHIRLHAEHQSTDAEAPYKCEICGKILVRRRDLERHMQSRHGSTSPVQASKSNHSIECSSPLSEADSSNGSNSSTMDDSDVDQVDVVEI